MKKSDLVIPDFQGNVNVGNKVVFVDGSYATAIINGVFTNNPYLGLSDDIWTVIAVNVDCPKQNFTLSDVLIHANNCICINDSGDIAFCSHINIRNIKKLGCSEPYTLKN